MLHLTKGLTENIYFTALENSAVAYSTFNFNFVNRLTEETLLISNLQNISITGRYQKVVINVNNYFNTKTTGLWEYTIFVNNNIQVENGLMYLHPATDFTPTEYNAQLNTFYTYNGK